MFIPTHEIDGYGERPDIALARSRSEDTIMENADAERFEAIERFLNSDDWGDLNQQSIVDLILEMMRRGTSSMLGNKGDIHWGQIESISEAVNEACVIEGLDEDCYSPTIRCDGFEYEIRLY